MDASEGDEALNFALERPQDFVLKPQREGGSFNLFDADLRKKLLEMRHSEERNGWILMDLIVPIAQKNILVRCGQAAVCTEVNAEVGIYGLILTSEDETLINGAAGSLVRTKPTEEKEAGILDGHGCFSSLFLY